VGLPDVIWTKQSCGKRDTVVSIKSWDQSIKEEIWNQRVERQNKSELP
jgi:hypothetical protein